MKPIRFLNQKVAQPYLTTFKGLSREVWWLALITLINRAGTMVIPFLSIYLNEHMGFTPSKIGWVMSAFGLGAVAGGWLGGMLTDKIGYYKVMFISLIGTGIMFVILQYSTTFYSICLGVFGVLLVADMFRPAMYVALSTYSKPENKTRSVTLIRLAINLGFSVGPAIGGLIISAIGYYALFWIDGITCVFAGLVLLLVLHPKTAKVIDEAKVTNTQSAHSDKPFLVFLAAMFLFGFMFLQYFSTVPLYYKNVAELTESEIGLIMAMNGFVIFLLEMPLIKILVDGKHSKLRLMIIGSFLMACSLWILNLGSLVSIVVIGMLLMTIGEMIFFPFTNSFVMERAKGKKQGQYMGLYTVAFALAHIFAHNSGMHLIDAIGYENTWYLMASLGIGCIALLIWLKKMMKVEISRPTPIQKTQLPNS